MTILSSKTFPEITFPEFQSIPYIEDRSDILKRNKILKTDAYNRTMDYIKWERWNREETFYLSLRKSPNKKFNVIYWVKSVLDEVLRTPITQNELDFAKDFYKNQSEKWWNWRFNPKRWQKIIDENGWMLPLKVSAVEDGTILKPWEPAIIVKWEWEIAAIFEPLFLRLFYKSVVATWARIIDEIIWEWRVVENWYRASINDDSHIGAMEALMVWWWINKTSSDLSAWVLDIITDWTTAHRFFTAYETEDEAMEAAIQKNEKIALLVDSVEAYSWMDKIIKLKKKYPQKIIAPRLDSWDIVNQTIYFLNQMKENWLTDPSRNKIIISSIETVDDIIEIETAVMEAWFNPKDYILYWIWWLLIAREKTRDVVSGGYKLSNTQSWATMKFSNDNGKQSLPWEPNIEIRDGKRYLVQEDEEEKWLRLLIPMYDNWKFFYDRPKLEDIPKARKRLTETMAYINYDSELSEETTRLIDEVKKRVWKK